MDIKPFNFGIWRLEPRSVLNTGTLCALGTFLIFLPNNFAPPIVMNIVPWVRAILHHLLAILPPLVSIIQNLNLGFCFECNFFFNFLLVPATPIIS